MRMEVVEDLITYFERHCLESLRRVNKRLLGIKKRR
jgi:hypothetical protein